MAMDERKQKALHDFRAKLLQHKEVNDRVRSSTCCAPSNLHSPSAPHNNRLSISIRVSWLNHVLIVFITLALLSEGGLQDAEESL